MLSEILGDRMDIFRSAPFCLELVPKGIDKAKSLLLSLIHIFANVGDFSQGLTYQGKNEIKVEKSYDLRTANVSHVDYHANQDVYKRQHVYMEVLEESQDEDCQPRKVWYR